MWLSELEVDRLRNLKENRLALAEGLTVVVGENGQGKTSLLEAVFLLGTGRSFRTRRLDEVVPWEGGLVLAAGDVNHRLGRTRLAVQVEEGSRRLVVDGSERELETYLGRLDVVDLTGERMLVLRGGPEERRRFLDRGVVGLRPGYLRDLGQYRRVMAQRNALLRRGAHDPGSIRGQLDVWDERLVGAALVMHMERRAYVERLGEKLGELGRALLPPGHSLAIRYRPSPASTGDAPVEEFAAAYGDALGRHRARDLALGHSSQGPHRDELTVELDGVDLRRFGSAGQVRAAMIALKLGKLSLLRQERGDAPVFLMDDFDTDLDEVRASALADFLQQGGFQALVATSKETLPGRLGVAFLKVVMNRGVARAA